MGTKGTLIGEGKELKLKYLDPQVELQKIEADPSTPGEKAIYGNAEVLSWVEETITLSGEDIMDQIRDCFYETIRNNKPYPVVPEEGII